MHLNVLINDIIYSVRPADLLVYLNSLNNGVNHAGLRTIAEVVCDNFIDVDSTGIEDMITYLESIERERLLVEEKKALHRRKQGKLMSVHGHSSINLGESYLATDCKVFAEVAAGTGTNALYRFFANIGTSDKPEYLFITAYSSFAGVATEHDDVSIPKQHW